MTHLNKIIILISIATFCVMILLVYCYKMKHPTVNENSDRDKIKYILYWPTFNYRWWIDKWGNGYAPFDNCGYNKLKCFAVDTMYFMAVENFDAIIFHASNNKEIDGIPKVRSLHQVYILANSEAPLSYFIFRSQWDLNEYASFFNWTMTYRSDSDIVNPYGYVYKNATNYRMPDTSFLKNKSGVAWFASHCDTTSKREVLAKELQKLYKVDIYGNCGNLTCSKNDNCDDMLEQKYKFYLSFENAYCKDYTTEKLFDLLRLNVVPIVYSNINRNASVLPPRSVINVEDFKNVNDLADYLKYLDDNVDEYAEYFKWKKDYVVISMHNIAACRLCVKLHQPVKESIYEDVDAWWYSKQKSMCKSGKELPKIVSDLLE